MKKLFCAAAAVAAFAPLAAVSGSVETAAPESVGMSSARLERMSEYFAGLVDTGRSGGYQLLVARRGEVIMHENIGYADVEAKEPLDDDSLFRIYSMTKPIVGVAMMMLYEEGFYSLSDPIAKHIPEFADLKVYAGEADDGSMLLEDPARLPTMHDLLRHTAGFTYGVFSDTAVDKLYREANFGEYGKTLQDFIDQLAQIPLQYQPGTAWVYSVSVDIQGYLIEKWSGMSVEEYLHERLLDPLGMDETFAWAPQDRQGQLVQVYTHNEERTRVPFEGSLMIEHLRPPTAFNGGAQLISTSDDYWRFCQMLLNGGEFEGKRYLSRATIDMMTSNRLGDIAYRPGLGFGLNFGVITDRNLVEMPASNGEYNWGGLATTSFWIDPEEELIVVFMTQYLPSDNAYYRDLLHRLVRAAIID